jgi:hypothetical protein
MPNVHGGGKPEFGERVLEEIVVAFGCLLMETSGASVCLEDRDGAMYLIENVMEDTLFSFLEFGLGKWG